jgi:TPR repeat protein
MLLKANEGDSEAQFHVGTSYYHGTGIGRDFKKALRWITIAANNGHKDAIDYLNIAPKEYVQRELEVFSEPEFENELVLFIKEENYLEKLKHAAINDKKAQYYLGKHYYFNENDKDINKAIEIWTLAANDGHVDAQYRLARHFDKRGHCPNSKLAIHYSILAAKQGHKEAQYLLAYYYHKGFGVSKNKKKAFDLWLSLQKRDI